MLEQEIEDIERYGAPVPIELKAGEAELHADMLAHGSPPNPSARRRCGVTLRYCPTSVRSINRDWTAQSVLCRGRDEANYWLNVPRPVGDDLRLPHQRKVKIGAN